MMGSNALNSRKRPSGQQVRRKCIRQPRSASASAWRQTRWLLLAVIILGQTGAKSAMGRQSALDVRENDVAPAPAVIEELLTQDKLIDAEEIVDRIARHQDRVRVIVNLVDRAEPPKAADWRNAQAMGLRRARIAGLQGKVLAKLPGAEYTLRHRFENQAGFSVETSLEGLKALLNDGDVESVEPVYVLEAQGRQALPLMNAMVHRSTYNGAGLAIAICDTGIDTFHPSLGGGRFPNDKVIGGYDFGENDADPSPSGNAHGTA